MALRINNYSTLLNPDQNELVQKKAQEILPILNGLSHSEIEAVLGCLETLVESSPISIKIPEDQVSSQRSSSDQKDSASLPEDRSVVL